MLYLFLFSLLIQIFFAWWYRYRPAVHAPLAADALPGVSILICGKNEAEHFLRFLPYVLDQSYAGAWEVLVVNDGSTDDSAAVLSALQQDFPLLRVLTIDPATEKTFPGKKYALWQGLKQCTYDLVLLTDADCMPAGKDWLHHMAATYQAAKLQTPQQSYFVLGYGAYEQKPGLLNAFIRWETVHTFMQYTSWARAGYPYMGVGRNLMYERTPVLQALDQDDNFTALFRRTASGDDDLIVSYLALSQQAVIVDHPEAKTISAVKETWADWWKQKTRHVSSGKYYAERVKHGLAAYAFSGLLFWASAIALLQAGNQKIQIIVLILLLLRIGIYSILNRKWCHALDEKGRKAFSPLGDLMWVGYNIILTPYIFFKNKQQWK
ncbi:Beta-monoglucosyldiacylglycerol synthase [compost metagenome]